ncbi:MAG: hypothetical protein Q9M23_01625, partial [Mariprofundaceae bacterium]|nr:hypothetical protein [Mariprofundaceae bacterium]
MKAILLAGRRILLAGVAVMLLLGGWFYLQAPSLNELRPQLESLLARQLGLKDLHLGNLSWRWAGHVWLSADNLSFIGAERRIKVEDAQLVVRLSSWDLLRGDIHPTSIGLRHGRISLHIPRAAAGESFPLPAGVLRIEDSSVTLNYGTFSNRFEHLDLSLDADRQTLAMQMPGFNLDVAWNAALQPVHVQARFDNLLWLPEAWRASVQGAFTAEVQLDKSAGSNRWDMLADIQSDAGIQLLSSDGRARLPLNQLRAKAHVESAANPLDITSIDWQELLWKGGENSLQAKGQWVDGVLKMQMQGSALQVESLAALGMPLADEAMRVWLAGLAGTVTRLQVDLTTRQSLPFSLPEAPDLKQGGLQVEAELSGGTIPLVTPGEELHDYHGSITLNSDGLAFRASSMGLPLRAGVVHGSAVIRDFEHPVFDIEGQGQVDIGLLEAWMQ